jgi:hypothetical protein
MPLAIFLVVFTVGVFADEGPKLKSMAQLKFSGIQRQTLDYSCGAASLAILLNDYFEDSIQEGQILSDIVLRLQKIEVLERAYEGFSMLDLKLVANHLGYNADGVVLPKESLDLLKGPVIVLLHKGKLNHFVVLRGVSQGRAFLADPSRGNIRVPLYEFFEEWRGEALIVGRDGFGLPREHGLSLPQAEYISPENQSVRTMQHTPIR